MWVVISSVLCVAACSWAFIYHYYSPNNVRYEDNIYWMMLTQWVMPAALVLGVTIGSVIGWRVTRGCA